MVRVFQFGSVQFSLVLFGSCILMNLKIVGKIHDFKRLSPKLYPNYLSLSALPITGSYHVQQQSPLTPDILVQWMNELLVKNEWMNERAHYILAVEFFN